MHTHAHTQGPDWMKRMKGYKWLESGILWDLNVLFSGSVNDLLQNAV